VNDYVVGLHLTINFRCLPVRSGGRRTLHRPVILLYKYKLSQMPHLPARQAGIFTDFSVYIREIYENQICSCER